MPVDGCRYTRYSPGWYCDIWIIVYVITLFVVTTKSLSFSFFLSLRFNGHFPGGQVSRYQNVSILDLLELRGWRVVVTTGAIVKMSPPTNQHPLFTGRMPFLSPNQQCQSTTLWFKKNAPTLADYNYDPVQSILIIFSKLFANNHKSYLVVKFFTSPHICCETQCSILH